MPSFTQEYHSALLIALVFCISFSFTDVIFSILHKNRWLPFRLNRLVSVFELLAKVLISIYAFRSHFSHIKSQSLHCGSFLVFALTLFIPVLTANLQNVKKYYYSYSYTHILLLIKSKSTLYLARSLISDLVGVKRLSFTQTHTHLSGYAHVCVDVEEKVPQATKEFLGNILKS